LISFFLQIAKYLSILARASAENFAGEGGNEKKQTNISKKYRKIALFSLFQGGGGNGKKTEK